MKRWLIRCLCGVAAALALGFVLPGFPSLDSEIPVPAPVDASATAPAPVPAPPVPVVEVLVPFDGPIEHIFFHPLIIYPELAFDGDSLSRGYDDWFTTVAEFRRILDALHANGYVLVNLESVVAQRSEDGKTTVSRLPLLLPPGKKPLVLSVDDINYYAYMRQNGNAHRLVVDEGGRLATYSVNPKGEPVTAYDNDIVPLVESFVAEHPDFSFRGARGILAVTGYEGILGYRTDQTTAPGYEGERTQAELVVRRLKELGWTFAAHGWGHLDAAKVSYNTLAADTNRWKSEVEPLTGPTPVYIYPFGSGVRSEDPKLQLLRDAGFRIFCGVGPTPFLKVEPTHAIMDRRHLDGLAFRDQRQSLLPLFDTDQIIDKVRPSR